MKRLLRNNGIGGRIEQGSEIDGRTSKTEHSKGAVSLENTFSRVANSCNTSRIWAFLLKVAFGSRTARALGDRVYLDLLELFWFRNEGGQRRNSSQLELAVSPGEEGHTVLRIQTPVMAVNECPNSCISDA